MYVLNVYLACTSNVFTEMEGRELGMLIINVDGYWRTGDNREAKRKKNMWLFLHYLILRLC